MGMTHYMELMMGSWYLLVLFITRAVKPVPSGGAHFTDIVNWLSKFKKKPLAVKPYGSNKCASDCSSVVGVQVSPRSMRC